MLLHTLTADLKRSITSKTFLLAILLTVAVMAIGGTTSILKMYDQYSRDGILIEGVENSITEESLASAPMMLCMPIIASITYTTAFVDDIKSGFIKHFLTRTSYTSYILSKIIACAISSALVLCIGIFAGRLAIGLIVAPIEAQAQVISTNVSEAEIERMMEKGLIDEGYIENEKGISYSLVQK